MKRRTFLKGAAGLAAPMIVGSRAWAAQDLELLEPGVLSAATDGTNRPYSYVDSSGALDGLEIRMMKEITARLGLEYKPVITVWDSMLVGLLADKYDMTSESMAITAERQKQVTFCDGWLESGAQLLVCSSDSSIKSVDDTTDKKIGVLTSSIYVPIVESWGAKPLNFKAEVDTIQGCVNGQVDGMVTDAVVAAYAISERGLPLFPVGEPVSRYQMGWAVKKGKPNLVTAINETRAAMVADGTVKRLFADLIGFDPSPKDPIRSIL